MDKRFKRWQMLWTSPIFERITFKLGAYLLLLSNIFLPFGLHRMWMKIGGWWLFPVTFGLSCIGVFRFFMTGVAEWKILSMPIALLFIFDALLLSIVPAPLGDEE
jgi:hypothetical protein